MISQMKLRVRSAFTLIELLVVIGVLAILLTITLIAINPQRQFQQANNTKRSSDVNAILNAVHQYAADTSGTLPSGITVAVQNISNIGANICAAIVPTYMAALPADPSINNGAQISNCSVAYDTGYTIVATSANRVTVAAPQAELQQTISVTR